MSTESLYCPFCGLELEMVEQGGPKPTVMITCWNPICKANGCTGSVRSLKDGSIIARWGFEQRYDYTTGKKIKK